jgi:hypothetical protein
MCVRVLVRAFVHDDEHVCVPECVFVCACVFVRARACESVHAYLVYVFISAPSPGFSVIFVICTHTHHVFIAPAFSPCPGFSVIFIICTHTHHVFIAPTFSAPHHQSMRRVGLAGRKTSFFFDTRQADALTKRIGNLHREVEGHEFDDGARSRHGCQFAIQSSGIREYQNPLLFAHGAGSAK